MTGPSTPCRIASTGEDPNTGSHNLNRNKRKNPLNIPIQEFYILTESLPFCFFFELFLLVHVISIIMSEAFHT